MSLIKITFIVNGKFRKLKQLTKDILLHFNEKFEVKIFQSLPEKGFEELTKNAIIDNRQYIILCGGDGSINEGINGFFNSDSQQRDEISFGVFRIQQNVHILINWLHESRLFCLKNQN